MSTSSITTVPPAPTTCAGLPLSPLTLRELFDRKSDANVQVAVCADMDVRDTGSFPATRYSRTLLDQWLVRAGPRLRAWPGQPGRVRCGGEVMSITDAAAAWDASMAAWGASADTRRSRRHFMVRLERMGWTDLTTVTRLQVETFLANPDFKPWTRATYHNHLRAFFGWAAEMGIVTTNPTTGVRRPRNPGTKPKPLSDTEQAAVLEAARGDTRTWILLALYAGLRAHEVAKIRGEHVTQDTILVAGKGGKQAYIETHPTLWALAQDYPRAGWWFPRAHHDAPIARDLVFNKVGFLFDDLGIEGSIHRCRHTFATTLVRRGANLRVVQDLMRHTSLATTQVYLEVTSTERRDAVRLLG